MIVLGLWISCDLDLVSGHTSMHLCVLPYLPLSVPNAVLPLSACGFLFVYVTWSPSPPHTNTCNKRIHTLTYTHVLICKNILFARCKAIVWKRRFASRKYIVNLPHTHRFANVSTAEPKTLMPTRCHGELRIAFTWTACGRLQWSYCMYLPLYKNMCVFFEKYALQLLLTWREKIHLNTT